MSNDNKNSERIATISLDETSIRHRTPEVENERTIALTDLLHENSFAPAAMQSGPYDLRLSIEDNRLVFDIKGAGGEQAKVMQSAQPFRGLIRDYFIICESYFEAIKSANSARLEAVDMGRRGVHNEASELLQELLEGKIAVDFCTARRLFTLICVLHLK